MPSVMAETHQEQACDSSPQVDLWGLDEAASDDLKRSALYLNMQELRTTSEGYATNSEVIRHLSHLTEPSQGIEHIEYINQSDFTVQQFQDQFLAHGRPCMIRGSCNDWKATQRWQSPADIKQWHGDVPIRITEIKLHASAKAQSLRIPLKNYLTYAEQDSGRADFPWYGLDVKKSAVPDAL
jgi:hypothetical protein